MWVRQWSPLASPSQEVECASNVCEKVVLIREYFFYASHHLWTMTNSMMYFHVQVLKIFHLPHPKMKKVPTAIALTLCHLFMFLCAWSDYLMVPNFFSFLRNACTINMSTHLCYPTNVIKVSVLSPDPRFWVS